MLLEKEIHLQSQTLFEQSTHLKQRGKYLHNNCWNLMEEQTSFLTDTVFTNGHIMDLSEISFIPEDK